MDIMRWHPFKFRLGAPRPVAKRSRSPRGRRYVRLRLQRLEDRITPVQSAFELDGNATTQITHDWDQVYNDAVLNPGQNTSGTIPGSVAFIQDPVNSSVDDVFT